MSSQSGAVRALLETIRWSAPPVPMNWSDVERAVGVRYPAEFRAFAEALPPGSFQTFLSVLHPGAQGPEEYVNEVRGYADLLRSEAEDQEFPYPVYPEPAGVLPWAVVGFDYIICWLTESDDPDDWPVVVCDSHLSEWEVHRLSTAEFLHAVLSVPTPVGPLAHVAEAQQPPAFVSTDGRTSEPAGPDEAYWNRAAEGRELIGPADCVDQLRGLVTPAPIAVPRWYDVWMRVQGKLGWPPPPDYKHLVEELGAIKVGPVTVAVPDGPVDFLKTYDKLRRRVVKERAAGGGPQGTVWPEPRGVLRWGDIEGGGHVCWLTVTKRPEFWPVMILDAQLRQSALHLMTASRFLLELATNPQGVVLPSPA